jgi:hypothetical protein
VGRAGDQGQGDEEGPVHEWLAYLRTLRDRHGELTEQAIATRLGLTARSRVSHLLRHAPPRRKEQASALLDAVGVFEWEKEYGLNLWELAKYEYFGDHVSRFRRDGKWGELSPLFAEVARSVVPTNGLRGRVRELSELAAFCADERRSYLWWQAEAWAGKTALLSSFVVDPPPGIVPVSFFVTGRQAGQDTSVAFLRDVNAHLEALSGTSQQEAAVQDGQVYLHWLLRECARLVSKDGQRLVLVVDGLDEDMSGAVGRRSIASVLPKVLEHGSKVLVSGRPNPRLPGGGNAEVPDRLLPGREVARRLRQLRYGSVQQLQQQAGQLGGALAIVAAQRAGQRFPHRVDRMDGFAQRRGPVLGERQFHRARIRGADRACHEAFALQRPDQLRDVDGVQAGEVGQLSLAGAGAAPGHAVQRCEHRILGLGQSVRR